MPTSQFASHTSIRLSSVILNCQRPPPPTRPADMRSETRESLMRWCTTTAFLPGRASRLSHSSGVCAAIAELVRRPNQARSWRTKWTCSQNLQVEFDGKNGTGRNLQTRPLKWQASATSWAVGPTKGAAYLNSLSPIRAALRFAFLVHRIAVRLDAVGIVNEAIEDTISQRGSPIQRGADFTRRLKCHHYR